MGSVYGTHLQLQATEDDSVNGRRGVVRPAPASIPRHTGRRSMSLDDEKVRLRAAAEDRRRAAALGATADVAVRLCDNFRQLVASAAFPAAGSVVSGYWPMAEEMDVRPVLEVVHAGGYVCALPVVEARGAPLVFRCWQPGATLEAGPFGTCHPGRAAPELRPDVVLAPLLAFDKLGHRLGWGGGYYDHSLRVLRDGGSVLAVGVAFAAQEVAAIPHDRTDEPLDWVVTEEGGLEDEAGMRVLFCGDVVGKAGRKVVADALPELRRRLELDFIVVNGENAAHGFGITAGICADFYAAGVDVITTGNHVWAQREIIDHIGGDKRLLRPLNYPQGTPGRGSGVFAVPDGRRVLVINPMGRLFMDAIDDPFAAVEAALVGHRLADTVHCIVVDVHAEATSEKMAMGHVFDGRVSMVVGSHTHVPTADARILPGGTAYVSDAGMCGDYDSIIGMKKDAAIDRFVRKMPTQRLSPAEGEASLCAVYVETDDETGLAKHVAPLRHGGRLAEQWPIEGAGAASILP